MLVIERTQTGFARRTTFELQVFRDGHWVISAVFDDSAEALREAHRLDRAGKIVQLREESLDANGKPSGARTVFMSSMIKNIWRAERQGIANRAGLARKADRDAVEKQLTEINPFLLLTIFSLIAFFGLAAIFALRTLYDVV